MAFSNGSNVVSPCGSSTTSCSSSSSSTCRMVYQSVTAQHHRLEELKDTYSTMLRQEATTYKTTTSPFDGDEDELDDCSWRPMMATWMYNMVDMFQLAPSVAGTAMYFLDKGQELLETPLEYQLLGLTSLQLAIKVHETKLMPVEQLVRIGNSEFTVDDVIRMEQRLLVHLNYYLHPPTAECFVLAFFELLPKSSRLLRHALSVVRKSMLSTDLRHIPYSVLAYASLLVAMEGAPELTMDHKKTFGWNMLHLAMLSAETPGLVEAYESLAPASSLTSIRTKQSSSRGRNRRETQAPAKPAPQQPQDNEIIFEAENGFEVQFCDSADLSDISGRFKEMELQLTASFSPRHVAC